jgi:hypothetical protein
MVLVRVLNLKFLHGLAAQMIGTSNSPHYSTSRPERIGIPKGLRRSESKALIRRRVDQCMDRIPVS